MKLFKQLVGAFVVGGALAFIGQLIYALWCAVIVSGESGFLSTLAAPLTLASMGVVGGVLYLPGIYDKLEEWGGFGAMLPFSGFCVAVSHTVEGAKVDSGSFGKAVKAGAVLVAQIIGVGSLGAVILAAIAVFANTYLFVGVTPPQDAVSATAVFSPGVPLSVGQLFGSFLIGGTICTLFQAFAAFTGLSAPKVLILGMLVGGLLTPAGMMSSMEQLGCIGAQFTAVGAGSAVMGTAMLLFSGIFAPFVTVLCVFVALTILGCVWGLIRATHFKSPKNV
ncbi:MAG: SpoVA/SpoVAEb family sporulation membrane protein [Coriobacteriales bacterium]|nr:SpoVA/SpoVAEb family sporulation membrane protein [Coriobacteriales bacterium]